MTVNMQNVSSEMWVSLNCGSFFTRLYCIASLKPVLFMELCVCVCGELLCEKKKLCHFCMRLLWVPT